MRYIITLTLVLVAFWLAISGVYKPVILMLGAGAIALVVWLAVRMRVVGIEHDPALFSWRLPLYWGWLLKEIVKANLNVARVIFSPSRVRPRLLTVPAPHDTAVARVAFANSVTLTPGTASLLLADGKLTVHALDEVSARGLEDGAIARKISWLEGSNARERT